MKIFPSPVYFLFSCLLLSSLPLYGSSEPPIRLAEFQFDPLVSTPVPASPREKIFDPSGRGYYILQFSGPVREEWKELCESRGVEFLDYIPDFAFIVRMDDKTRAEVENLTSVRWIGNYEPAYRLPSRLKRLPAKADSEGQYIVIVFPGADVDAVIGGVRRVGGRVLRRSDTRWKTRLRVSLSPDRPETLAALPGVKWVEEPPRWQFFNDQAREIINAEAAWTRGSYFGAGQVVGVADSGLDLGSTNPWLLHPDFLDGTGASRVLAISTDFSDFDIGFDANGHGTHVAGSILGSGKLSDADPSAQHYPSTSYAGVAPEASLVFQALGNMSMIPYDLNQLFAQAYGAGARVHNNSWGSIFPHAGEYTSWSEDVDEFSWDNKDFLAVFAAGNAGIDSNADGIVDLYSVGAPATAKNCLAVGASENYRPPGSSPQPGLSMTYGWYWPWYFPSAPISSDYLSDNPEGIFARSSRGADLAARWKPEIVAPGTNVISCRTGAAPLGEEILWGTGGLTGAAAADYVFSGGTSMAAPLVTGSAALVREYYQRRGLPNPSAALIKATLINSARDISPGQYGTGQYQEIPGSPRPNNVAGWGRLDLSSTIFSENSPDFRYFDISPGLTTGGVHNYSVEVSYSFSPLSVTLCWTDHPGSTPAGGALVNDLDLTVTGPGGTVYYPNNAQAAGPLFYDNGRLTDFLYGFEGMIEAVRFTPDRYPATLERGMFFLSSRTERYSKTVEYRVYSGSASGPSTLLASGNTTLRRGGWHNIDLSSHNITINSGDFYLAIVLPDNDLSWGAFSNEQPTTPTPMPTPMPTTTPTPVADNGSAGSAILSSDVPVEPIAGRSWRYMSMLGWVNSITHDYLFRAVVSTPALHDRTNNTIGIDIEFPVPGTYTVTVSGYNVPFGPQPYALVVSRPDRGVVFPDRPVIASGDYNGNGISDIAIFRPISGLWAVRGVTRAYFGGMGDVPASGDYDGDGTTDFAVFRPSTGLWAVSGVTRAYFGGPNDLSVPGDYSDNGRTDIAVFRPSSGLWAIRGVTRFYFGKSGDLPVSADYDSFNPGRAEPAIFRPSTGLWAIRDSDGSSIRLYLGASGDIPVPANYDALPGDNLAVFRPASGLWAVYEFDRYYFGRTKDIPVPAYFNGKAFAPPAVFRPASGLWAVKGLTRAYFGRNHDIPVVR